MTGTEIRVAAQLMLGVQIDTAAFLIYINEGIEDIVEEYKHHAPKAAEKTIEVTDYDAFYATDVDIIRVDGLYDSYNQRIKGEHFRFKDDDIQVDLKGTYTLKYRKYPTAMTDEADEPDIVRQFHRALVKFVAYKEALRLYGAVHSDTLYNKQEYEKAAAKAYSVLQGRKSRYIRPYFND